MHTSKTLMNIKIQQILIYLKRISLQLEIPIEYYWHIKILYFSIQKQNTYIF